jgi:ABC-type multidrug transport system ATPase subunit
MSILTTKNLCFRFNNTEQILTNINLDIPEGTIYGFLGQNGAGKTTTLKLLLGLLTNQEGEISIFNKPLNGNRIEILKQVGSLIESPAIYNHLTAKQNLEVVGTIFSTNKDRIEKVLSIIGLSNTGKKVAGEFSLGMKQRLALGIAILNQPKLLILDEPTNGLDPNGIIEIRELLIKINKEEGITILISSHILTEIEKLVSHLSIINKGELLYQGTIKELNELKQNGNDVIVETSDIHKTSLIMGNMKISYRELNGKLLFRFSSNKEIAELIKNLISSGVDVYEITKEKNNLENIFMDLIQN